MIEYNKMEKIVSSYLSYANTEIQCSECPNKISLGDPYYIANMRETFASYIRHYTIELCEVCAKKHHSII